MAGGGFLHKMFPRWSSTVHFPCLRSLPATAHLSVKSKAGRKAPWLLSLVLLYTQLSATERGRLSARAYSRTKLVQAACLGVA